MKINPDTEHTHSIIDKQTHAARRKMLNHAFSDNAMRNMEVHVLAKIRQWCDYLQTPDSGDSNENVINEKRRDISRKDMGKWSSYLTLDVLGQLCFTADFENMKNHGSTWEDVMPATMDLPSKVSLLQVISLLHFS